METYLLKLGELTLKKGNRNGFEEILKRNINAALRRHGVRLDTANGRFYVHSSVEKASAVEDALDHLFGIAGWAKTRVTEKTIDAVIAACVEEGKKLHDAGCRTFKVEAHRTDKSFPFDSYAMRCKAGDAVTENFPDMDVDVRSPQGTIEIEIREKAYVYAMSKKGLRGLPVGTAGRGLLLLSGGIDSPVAGFLMASRGMGIDALYFHAYPYTSDEAKQKVITLAGAINRYAPGIKLFVAGFTDVQIRIKEKSPENWTTIMLRMAMMELAERIARRLHSKCLITGESLSQVASQTIENIACTESRVSLPVLRPLIGMDKTGIIAIAEKIGTYKTSILPYEDCCVLFSPEHPVLRGDRKEAIALYESLCLSSFLDEALSKIEIIKVVDYSITPSAGNSR